MKKLLLLLLILFTSLACTDKNHQKLRLALYLPNDDIQLMKSFLKDFEEKFSAEILITKLDEAKCESFISGNEKWDVADLPHTWLYEAMDNNLFQTADLSYSPAVRFPIDITRLNFAYPWHCNIKLLFYNEKLLNSAGIKKPQFSNSSNIAAYSVLVETNTSALGLTLPLRDRVHAFEDLLLFISAFGADDFDSSEQIYNRQNTEAVYKFTDFASPALLSDKNNSEFDFIHAKAAMTISDNMLLNKLKSSANISDFAFTAPTIDGKTTILAKILCLAMSAECENPTLAGKLMEYLLSEDFLISFNSLSPGFIPLQKFHTNNDKEKLFALYDSSYLLPFYRKYTLIKQALNLCAENIIQGSMGPTGALKNAQYYIDSEKRKDIFFHSKP